MANGTANGGTHITTGAASVADSDYAADPASSTFFASDLKKHGDLKNMLESNKDQLRLEAMKRIIGMVAKGKDAQDLFPSVVKNVVSKNIEIKKLVYAYLVRYAEDQQDLALLSISTFQRALKDPNQLIRANALRVLSSIRVPVIVPIMMLAIKESTSDMSPYVRKTAALAIPKLYSLDDEQKDQLVEVIEKLLSDKTTLVIGSAVMAFEEVCPERIDLIHKNYRRLCQVLIDLEEWGQVAVLNMLTRYARTQFVNPNQDHDAGDGSDQENFYEDDEENHSKSRNRKIAMDSDHRLLLKCAKPLLQSRNSSVVMAVVQLYHHIGPRSEMALTVKPLIRLLRSHREIQSVVLSNIATLANKPERRQLLVPHLKTFFVRSSDPTFIKLQKLEILTSLASEGTIAIILREFQAYIASSDRELVASTIQAIGRCAITISEVTETCLNGLVNLLSNRDDNVVAESVCVIRRLLQLQPNAHKEIINHLAKLVEKIAVPMAKASIYWLIGEYCEQVPNIGPDVLRIAAKTFAKEENIVKLQIINLAAKLYTVNPKQVSLLVMYVFNMGKYDTSYDIRDRTRFLRAVILPTNAGGGEDGVVKSVLNKKARQILLSAKPAPVMESRFKDRAEFQLGTLSHFLNIRANGYQDLPEFPVVPPPSNTRDVILPVAEPEIKRSSPQRKTNGETTKPVKKSTKFYSDEEDSESEEEDEEEDEEDDDEESSDEESEEEDQELPENNNHDVKKKSVAENNAESSSEESGSEEDESSSEESSEEEKKPVKKPPPKKQMSLATISPEQEVKVEKKTEKPAAKSTNAPEASNNTKPVVATSKPKDKPVDNLLDLDDLLSTPGPSVIPMSAPMLPSGSPVVAAPKTVSGQTILPPVFVSNKFIELLSPGVSGGLGITYRFPRRPFVYSEKMVAVEFSFVNSSDSITFTNIKINRKKLPPRVQVYDFHEIASLEPRRTLHGTVGIDFGDSTQTIGLTIGCDDKEYDVLLKATVGEMLMPIAMDRARFDTNKANLSGLNESYANIDLPEKSQSKAALTNLIVETANIVPVSGGETVDGNSYALRFVGQTVSSGSAVLVLATVNGTKCVLTVNCEKVIVGSMVLKDLKDSVLRSVGR